MLVRDLEKTRHSCASFLEPGRIETIRCDLSSLESVRQAAAVFRERSGGALNVLVCNGAVMAIPQRQETQDGFEAHLATNYLGHFLLFWLLKDLMIASSTSSFRSRLIHVSSASHHEAEINFDDINLNGEGAYKPKNAYGQSKLAQIYMANQVDRLYGSKGVHALSLMPGGIKTGLTRFVPSAITEKIMSGSEFLQKWFKSPEQGAATTLVAAVGRDWEDKGGVYLENCALAKKEPLVPSVMGFKDFTFDEAKEQRLWNYTLKILELRDEP
jgi:NAD(P)-dependent dehydrogenase (short-subunit alcohol dehydrogenase family)